MCHDIYVNIRGQLVGVGSLCLSVCLCVCVLARVHMYAHGRVCVFTHMCAHRVQVHA